MLDEPAIALNTTCI